MLLLLLGLNVLLQLICNVLVILHLSLPQLSLLPYFYIIIIIIISYEILHLSLLHLSLLSYYYYYYHHHHSYFFLRDTPPITSISVAPSMILIDPPTYGRCTPSVHIERHKKEESIDPQSLVVTSDLNPKP